MVRERAAEWKKRKGQDATIRTELYSKHDIMGGDNIGGDIWDGNKVYVTKKGKGKVSETNVVWDRDKRIKRI